MLLQVGDPRPRGDARPDGHSEPLAQPQLIDGTGEDVAAVRHIVEAHEADFEAGRRHRRILHPRARAHMPAGQLRAASACRDRRLQATGLLSFDPSSAGTGAKVAAGRG